MATNFTRQAAAYDRLAKKQNDVARDMLQDNTATADQLQAAIVMYDMAVRSYYTADSMEQQAAAYSQKADDAGELP